MTRRTIDNCVNDTGRFSSYLYIYLIFGFQGQFNYVNIVITPLDHGSNAVTVQSRDGTLLYYL